MSHTDLLSSAAAGECLRCPAELTLATVEAVQAAWLIDPAAGRASVLLDGAAITTVDTAGLQLLACFVVELARTGRSWQWQAISPALLKSAACLGLTSALSLPSDSS